MKAATVRITPIEHIGSVNLTAHNHIIYEAAMKVNGILLDDHRSGDRTLRLWGLATLEKDDSQIVVALVNTSAFSVNEVYIDDKGQARISRKAVGGTVVPMGPDMVDAIKAYNETQVRNAPYTNGQLTNAVKFQSSPTLVPVQKDSDMTTANVAVVSVAANPTLKVSNAAIYAAAEAVKGLIADDHAARKTIQLWGVATLEKGDEQTVVALIDARYFCLNGVYLDSRGGVHLSTNSVGGTIELHGAPMEDGIEQYNAEQAGFPFSSGQLTNVVKF